MDDHDGLLKSVQWKSVFVDNAVDNIERFKNDIQRIIEIVTTGTGRMRRRRGEGKRRRGEM